MRGRKGDSSQRGKRLHGLRRRKIPRRDGWHFLRIMSPGTLFSIHGPNQLRNLRCGDDRNRHGSGGLRRVPRAIYYQWDRGAKLLCLYRRLLLQLFLFRVRVLPERLRLLH